MNFDLRFPIGFLFSVFGLVLTVFGKLSDPKIYDKSLGMNINFIWGLVLLVFGGVMLTLAFRGRSRAS